jgi:hypothetical protein
VECGGLGTRRGRRRRLISTLRTLAHRNRGQTRRLVLCQAYALWPGWHTWAPVCCTRRLCRLLWTPHAAAAQDLGHRHRLPQSAQIVSAVPRQLQLWAERMSFDVVSFGCLYVQPC